MSGNHWSKLLIAVLCSGYVLAVVLTVVLINWLEPASRTPLQVKQAVLQPNAGSPRQLELNGEGFHRGVNAVLATDPLASGTLLQRIFPDSHMRGMAVKDGLVVVSCGGDRLVISRVGAEKTALPLSSILMPEKVLSVHVVGHTAVVGLGSRAGTVLVDISDPLHPEMFRWLKTMGLIVDAVSSDSTIYLADLYLGLTRIDFAGPEPTLETLSPIESAWRIASDGNKLVVGSLQNSLELFAFDRSGGVEKLAHLVVPDQVRGLAMTNNLLCVALMNGQMEVYDTTAWPTLRKTARFHLNGRPHRLAAVPGRPLVMASLAGLGVELIDIADAARPVLLKHLLWPRQFLDVEIHNNQVFAGSFDGLEVFSLAKILGADASASQLVHYKALLPVKWGNHLYGYANRQLVPLSLPRSSEELYTAGPLLLPDKYSLLVYRNTQEGAAVLGAEIVFADEIIDVTRVGNRLYLLHRDTLKVYDCADLGQLVELAAVKLPGQADCLTWLKPGCLLVSTTSNGLMVIDTATEELLAIIAQYQPVKHLRDHVSLSGVAVFGERACLALGQGGVAIVNLSRPERPQIENIFQTPGYAKDVCYKEGFLLVGMVGAGIYLFDVDMNGSVQPVGVLPVPISVQRVVAHDGEVYAFNRSAGVVKLPMPVRTGGLQLVDQYRARMTLPLRSSDAPQRLYLYDGESMVEKYLDGDVLKHRSS